MVEIPFERCFGLSPSMYSNDQEVDRILARVVECAAGGDLGCEMARASRSKRS